MKSGVALFVSLIFLLSVFSVVSILPFDKDYLTGNFIKDYESMYGNSFKLKSEDRVYINDKAVVFLKASTGKNSMNQIYSGAKTDGKVMISVASDFRDEIQYFIDELRYGRLDYKNEVAMTLVDLNDDPEIENDWAKIVFLYDGAFDYLGYFKVGDTKLIDGHEVILNKIYVDKNTGDLTGYVDVSVDGETVRLNSFDMLTEVNGLALDLNTMTFDKARLFFTSVNHVDF